MKTTKYFAAALLMTPLAGYGQVTLGTGASYTYRFERLEFQGQSTFGNSEPSGTVFLYVDPTFPLGLRPNDAYRVEIFEDTSADPPVLSRTITSRSRIHETDYRVPGIWGDLQGSIRVTVLSGSIILRGFSFQAIKVGSPVGFDIYGTSRIFVPPPPVLSLVPAGSAMTVRWPSSGTNFVLEAGSSLTSSVSWGPVTNAVALSGGMLSVTIEPAEVRQFFRLKWTGP